MKLPAAFETNDQGHDNDESGTEAKNFKDALSNVLDKAFKARSKEIMADDLKQDMEYLLNFLPHFMKSYK